MKGKPAAKDIYHPLAKSLLLSVKFVMGLMKTEWAELRVGTQPWMKINIWCAME